jgi:2-amino-4-hydroxy-6-hydroxymethyldihydropteridine diphosphokinase
LGDRRRALEVACRRLGATPGLSLLAVSRWYRTPPLRGGSARGWFLNGVAVVECALDAEALLRVCRAIEARAGRRRARFWGDRTLDLDVLVVEGTVRAGQSLVLPHPALRARPFVWGPLLEVWPDVVDPKTGDRIGASELSGLPRPVRRGVCAIPRRVVPPVG